MATTALALVYALFVWWFSTGLVLLLVLRREALRASLAGAALLVPLSLYGLAKSSIYTGMAGVYLGFTAAVLLWGSQEIAFLTGCLTGPRPAPCPPGARGSTRFTAAIGAILYHELALLASTIAVVAVTWGGTNQTGSLTFLVLWIMRISAKLNLFLGVPELHDEFLPERIGYIRSYFRRGSVNSFFPLSVLLSVLIGCGLVVAAIDPEISVAKATGYSLVAGLMGLAILEHLFMLVRLPLEKLWGWSLRQRSRFRGPATDAETLRSDMARIEHVVPTRS